jgi:thiamine-monophosphate kinase
LLGHKTLAVNLSDLAAMGATPRWATLALALPGIDEDWLERFSRGFFELADKHGVELVGGDTTRGPLNLSVTIMGEIPKGTALRRDGAQAGEDIWVSGSLGDAALALAHLQGLISLPQEAFAACAVRLHQPQPRVELGLSLRGIASSAIDVSDGLLADLGHILEQSQVGAELLFDKLPCSTLSRGRGSQEIFQRCVLAGGDDYELCFTAPVQHRSNIERTSATLALPLTRVGKITGSKECTVLAGNGSRMQIKDIGYDHFR